MDDIDVHLDRCSLLSRDGALVVRQRVRAASRDAGRKELLDAALSCLLPCPPGWRRGAFALTIDAYGPALTVEVDDSPLDHEVEHPPAEQE